MQRYELVSDFPINNRTKNALQKAGIETVEDLKEKTFKELKAVKGIGKDAALDLRQFLSEAKISLKRAVAAPKEKVDPALRGQAWNVVAKLLDGKELINKSLEYRVSLELIERYGYEEMMRVKLPPHVTSLIYLRRGEWISDFVAKFQPMRLAEVQLPQKEEKVVEKIEKIEYRPLTKQKPKNLTEFLGL